MEATDEAEMSLLRRRVENLENVKKWNIHKGENRGDDVERGN